MKSVSVIFNGVLFVLVAILYYLHFKGPQEPGLVVSKTNAPDSSTFHQGAMYSNPNSKSGTGKIVFVDYDSLVQNYDLFKKMENELQIRLKSSESELVSKQKKLEENYQGYMQGQSMMTDQHKATKEQQLTQQNQDLIELRDQRAKQFAVQEQELNEKLMTTLYGYFQKLARQNNFAYIFTYKKGMPGVVFGSDSLNITSQVIDGLNKEYRSRN